MSTHHLRPGDPALAFDPDLSRAREILMGFVPMTGEQGHTRARILAFLNEHPDALRRSCVPGHLTAAALVLDHTRERALLTHHAKLERWLQLGGHCDGDGNLVAVALREAVEESGIADLTIDRRPIDLDVHAIPARKDEPEHLHLDVRFLAFAPEGAVEKASKESKELGWFTPEEARSVLTDDSVLRLFQIAFGR